jgi:sulfite exporter TauE/SafE/copper chaperone CopZ
MHCRSCEILIEKNLSKVKEVDRVEVNQKKGTAEVFYKGKKTNDTAIEEAINKAGYSVGETDTKNKSSIFSRNKKDYIELLTAAIVVFGLFIVVSDLGITEIINSISNNYNSLTVVLLVGLAAGVSTCMALIGGLTAGISAQYAKQHKNLSVKQKFTPHIFFQIGRVSSFFVLGGLIGSFFQMSTLAVGILTVLVALVMLIMGLQLIGIFPKISNYQFTLPKGLAKFFNIHSETEKDYSHRGAITMGALTFFLPCGFTQAMQLYAVSTGSFLQGALTMAVFALGTAPGLIGIGGLTSFAKGNFANILYKSIGLIIIFLSFFNMFNGFNLTGIVLPSNIKAVTKNFDTSKINIENGYQIINMDQLATGYEPNEITIIKDLPVKWIIDSKAPSCASSITVPKYSISKQLQPGTNTIEFTPDELGLLKFTCSMGMYSGYFNVIDQDGNTAKNIDSQIADAQSDLENEGECDGNCGGGCGGGCNGGCGR